MGSFFHGWRRKMGCITLVMAVMIAIGWCRSYAIRDELYIPRPDRLYAFDSFLGVVQLERMTPTPDVFRVAPIYGNSRMIIPGETRQKRLSFENARSWEWGDFYVEWGTFEFGSPQQFDVIAIPYWFIVLIPTLLSAYLILGKQSQVPKPSSSTMVNPI